mmetsp:Transcript_113357/g.293432  ORF Transcript_113357/g.293432 Transcript_113357/m.293432 type:complete len:85 (-) Transcript_113357:36-290(-)
MASAIKLEWGQKDAHDHRPDQTLTMVVRMRFHATPRLSQKLGEADRSAMASPETCHVKNSDYLCQLNCSCLQPTHIGRGKLDKT